MDLAAASARGGAGSSLNSHIHFHVLLTDGVFSADPQYATRAEFHPATNLDATKVKAVANQMHLRGLR